MKDQQRKELEDRIRQEIEKTKQTIQTYEDSTQPIGPENAIGRLSRMDAINNQSVTEAALRQARKKLSDLQNMLYNIGDEEFGTCDRCGNPIPFKRLLLMPESNYCVHCAARR